MEVDIKFTFHYGPIQIADDKYCDNVSCIYIPLWSYSNKYITKSLTAVTKFTFHYGPIQIKLAMKNVYMQYEFTFHYGPIQICLVLLVVLMNFIYIPLWSYSNRLAAISLIVLSVFTFHYGPIQM